MKAKIHFHQSSPNTLILMNKCSIINDFYYTTKHIINIKNILNYLLLESMNLKKAILFHRRSNILNKK
jgi:hypothetical protein